MTKAVRIEVGILISALAVAVPVVLYYDAKQHERALALAEKSASLAEQREAVLNIKEGVSQSIDAIRELSKKANKHDVDITRLQSEAESLRREFDKLGELTE